MPCPGGWCTGTKERENRESTGVKAGGTAWPSMPCEAESIEKNEKSRRERNQTGLE
jgi:hypothetical protein